MKRDKFILQLVKCYLNLFFSFIMCFILSMTLMVFHGYTLISIVIQIFTLAITLLLLGNYAWKDGKNEIKLQETYGIPKISSFRWWALGLLTTLPLYILLGCLIFDKLGLTTVNFGIIYKLAVTQLMPLTVTFARPAASTAENVTAVVTGADYSWKLIAILGVLPLTIPVTMAVSHKISYKDEISEDTIVYKDIK